jgi:hypothetical protein
MVVLLGLSSWLQFVLSVPKQSTVFPTACLRVKQKPNKPGCESGGSHTSSSNERYLPEAAFQIACNMQRIVSMGLRMRDPKQYH